MQENTSNNIENFNRKVSCWMVPQKRCIVSKALLSISFEGAIIFIFYAENVSFNEFTNSHRTRSKFLVEKTLFHRKNVTSVSSSIEAYARQSWKTRSVSSGNVRLDPINASQFDRGGVYIGSMPIHHALQVSALLREGMFRGYL